jgi:protein SCO1/2
VTHRRLVTLALAAALTIGACGGDPPRALAGYRREPAPLVGDLSLPDLTDPGTELALRAEPGQLLVVYFGYTNCPDFCPTTLSDLKLAMRRMDADDAARIDVAMVTVDPERDVAVLPDYITSFFDDGHALGTDDAELLARAAAPFGVTYAVARADDGTIEVAHTTALYVVDDVGQLALTWQFGVSIDDLAADLTELLETTDA